jgi:hypothetical protein
VSKSKSKVAPHPFQLDPETPGDPISGEQVCARCRCLGHPEDTRHAMPEPAPDAQSRAAGDN